MFDFSFSLPTQIVHGDGCERQVGELMKLWADKVMIVYGSERIFNEKNGLGNCVVKSLNDAGCKTVLCGGVKANAHSKFIDDAVKIVRKEHINGIVAVGGGSVIDSAKAISAASCFQGSVEQLYENLEQYPEMFLPIGAIVTIPATASESNDTSVISIKDKKLMRKFEETRPKFALLDPQLTTSVSSFQTASGGFDIFAHCFERYFDINRNSVLLDKMTVSVMRTLIEVLPKVLKEPGNKELRSEMMLAANVAHNDMLGPGGDFACHEISHMITEKFGTAHGSALAMIIPAWLRIVRDIHPDRMASFFEDVWDVKESNIDKIIDTGIEKMERFIEAIGLPLKLAGDGITGDEISLLSKDALAGRDYVGWGFAPMKEKDIDRILKHVLL